MDSLQRICRIIFPEYHCPSCGEKLYKLYQTGHSRRVISWEVDLLLSFILIPIVTGILTKLLGVFLGILVFLILCLTIVFRYCDRSNECYTCESCDKEYSFPELQKAKGK